MSPFNSVYMDSSGQTDLGRRQGQAVLGDDGDRTPDHPTGRRNHLVVPLLQGRRYLQKIRGLRFKDRGSTTMLDLAFSGTLGPR